MNEAATAAATPLPTMVMTKERDRWSRLPTDDASEAPSSTTGPSRPTEAPQPIDAALASEASSPRRSDISPSRVAAASITSATPSGRRSGIR